MLTSKNSPSVKSHLDVPCELIHLLVKRACHVQFSNLGSFILEISSPFPHSSQFAVGCHLIILLPLPMKS